MSKKCVLGCTIRSTLFEIFSHSAGPFGAAPFEKISNVDFSLGQKKTINNINNSDRVGYKWSMNMTYKNKVGILHTR